MEQCNGGVLSRAHDILRSEGARVLWFRSLGETLYRRMILFERLLQAPALAVNTAAHVTIAQLQVSEVDEYAAFRAGAVPTEIRSRLEQGQQCFVARRQGAMANVMWAARGSAWILYLGREIRLAPDEVYVYESYTAPSFRRLKISAMRADAMTRHFRERSFFRMLAAVMPENPAGVGATVNAGYGRAGVIGWVRMGPWTRDFCRMAPGSRPVTLRKV